MSNIGKSQLKKSLKIIFLYFIDRCIKKVSMALRPKLQDLEQVDIRPTNTPNNLSKYIELYGRKVERS